jgi:nitrite reductase (NADH) large subunit
MSAPKAWRCIVCGYVHTGAEPPEDCPICGAAREDFEPVEDAGGAATGSPSPAPASAPQAPRAGLKFLIIGGGMAGVTAAEAARELAPDAEITIVSGEPDLPYYRINLTRLLAGEIGETELPLHPATWYADRKIRLLTGRHAERLDAATRRVTLDDGSVLPYDRLLLATGAQPFVPPIPGAAGREGVFTLRNRADARTLLAAARPGAHIVFIGGGILGLEAATGLRKRGAEVTLLEAAGWLMPRQLNERGGRELERHATASGLTLVCNCRVSEIMGDRRAAGVRLEDGRRFPAETVVISAGVRPDTTLARTAGLRVERGIVVDDRLATSAPDIFAAGDAAEHRSVVYGTWDPARFQGQIAAWNALGRAADFGGLPPSNTLKVMGVRLFSIGRVQGGEGFRVIESSESGAYFGFFFEGPILAGAILLGDTTAGAGARKAVESRTDLGRLLAKKPDARAVAAHLAG